MNVPDNIWEQISELLDLGISLMKRITKEDDEKAKEFEQKFRQKFEEHRERAERIQKENDEKAKEFEQRSQKQREEMEAFRKKHFPNDD